MARFRLHHAPNTRASGSLWLLEEAGADYALVPHELAAGTQKQPAFLALNPQGKLPVLEDAGPAGDWRGVVVTEAGAIAAYLADALPEAGLAPAVGTPARALYRHRHAVCERRDGAGADGQGVAPRAGAGCPDGWVADFRRDGGARR